MRIAFIFNFVCCPWCDAVVPKWSGIFPLSHKSKAIFFVYFFYLNLKKIYIFNFNLRKLKFLRIVYSYPTHVIPMNSDMRFTFKFLSETVQQEIWFRHPSRGLLFWYTGNMAFFSDLLTIKDTNFVHAMGHLEPEYRVRVKVRMSRVIPSPSLENKNFENYFQQWKVASALNGALQDHPLYRYTVF